MKLSFSKYHHLGNDFIIFDVRTSKAAFEKEVVQKLCERHFGIGADGIILMRNSQKAAFKMEIFNCDGSKPFFCGNGFLCLLDYLRDFFSKEEEIFIETQEMVVKGGFKKNGASFFSLSDFKLLKADLEIEGLKGALYKTGVEHAVFLVEKLESFDVLKMGRKIRYHQALAPLGANVDFLSVDKENVYLRTYERGVEDETFACGSGALAAALFLALKYNFSSPILINLKKGIVEAGFKKSKEGLEELALFGYPTYVFSGSVDL